MIARADDEATRDKKTRRLDDVDALVRAKAALLAPGGAPVSSSEAARDGLRALAASLGIGSLGVLSVAVHDLIFGRAIAHAFSTFSLVGLGLALLLACVAATGRARALSRRSTLEALLVVLAARGASRP